MLTNFQLYSAWILTVGDAMVLRRYTATGSMKHRYPKKSFVCHVGGGLAAIFFGVLSLLAFQSGFETAGKLTGMVHGVCSALLLGSFVIPMARHTRGYPGANMVGYILYGVALIHTSMHCIKDTTPINVWASYVLGHAYLTCRLFVFAFEQVFHWYGDMSYSVATSMAMCIPLWITNKNTGLLHGLAITTCAIMLHKMGIGRLHAYRHGRNKSLKAPTS